MALLCRLPLRRALARLVALLLAFALVGVACGSTAAAQPAAPDGIAAVSAQALPPEARQTLELIRQGGPYPFERDGVLFGNREQLLPSRARSYYREYTVATPGLTHRGARRIVAGRGGELYYSDDHYRSFKRISE